MKKLELGDLVMHKDSKNHVFKVIYEMKSASPGEAPLYECELVAGNLDQCPTGWATASEVALMLEGKHPKTRKYSEAVLHKIGVGEKDKQKATKRRETQRRAKPKDRTSNERQ